MAKPADPSRLTSPDPRSVCDLLQHLCLLGTILNDPVSSAKEKMLPSSL